jgi:hypothetical protein
MQLPRSEFTARPWQIHRIAPDFRLEDIWAIPAPGGDDDFPRLVNEFAHGDPGEDSRSALIRGLFALRWKLGEWFGWDGRDTGIGSRVRTLQDRVPAELQGRPGPAFTRLPFHSLYLTEDEFAAEIANQTMHGIFHLGWVQGAGGNVAHMSVLVRPNGVFGRAYMAAIKPFRMVIYPPILNQLERQWRTAATP